MHENAETIRKFYECFGKKDAEGMVALYADDIAFSDPVFPDLKGDEAKAMWRMLCARAADLEVVASGIEGDASSGKAHWDATYTFSATGRKVLNRIDARFTFRDGKIATHTDTFDLWKWTRMALGFKGTLLGWSPIVRNAVRKQADKGLRIFMKKGA
ncbi:MAG: nuclear transport factor 2 family protein [Minicystis sp.]